MVLYLITLCVSLALLRSCEWKKDTNPHTICWYIRFTRTLYRTDKWGSVSQQVFSASKGSGSIRLSLIKMSNCLLFTVIVIGVERWLTQRQAGRKGTINWYIRRQVRDLPLLGYPCRVEIELAQVFISKNERRIENCDFVDKGARFTRRLCHLVSGMCRHMSIQAVSNHLGIRWETVKNIDKGYLLKTLPALDPTQVTDLKYIGVDEVARAKGHDYMTVVYDMVNGHLIWVEAGRTAEVFSSFWKQLPETTASAIEAVAMGMGPAYQRVFTQCWYCLWPLSCNEKLQQGDSKSTSHWI